MCMGHSPNQSTLGRLMKDKPSTEAVLCLQAAREENTHTDTKVHTPSPRHSHTALIKFTDVKALITKANPPLLSAVIHPSISPHIRPPFPTHRGQLRLGVTVNAHADTPLFLPLSLKHTHRNTLSPTYSLSRTHARSNSRQLLICYEADRTVMNFLQNKRQKCAPNVPSTSNFTD